MPTAAKTKTQVRLTKEAAERATRMQKQKAARGKVDFSRLENLGREIEVRVGKLNQLAGKTVDMIDSIEHLLADAEKLCDPAGFTFAAFKKTYCPKRMYELFAIRDGRKSVEEIRADTRKRVAKHRAAAKQDVTESDSVTSPNGEEAESKPEKTPEPTKTPEPELAGEEAPPTGESAEVADDAARQTRETPPTNDLTIPPFMDRHGEAPGANGHTKPDDGHSVMAVSLKALMNEALVLCEAEHNWEGLRATKEPRDTAIKTLYQLRELLVKIAAPKAVH